MHLPSLPAAEVFRCLAGRFEQDAAQGLVAPLTLSVGDCVLRLRATSATLRSQLLRPLACSLLEDSRSPDYTLDWIDLGSDPLPALPWPAHHTSREQQTSEYADGPYLFTRHSDVLLTAFNAETRHTVALVHNPAGWPLRHYKQGLFITLYQPLRRAGLHLIHASAISAGGRAALITGQSGVGKTTTMLTCVAAGLQFVSDDSTLLRRLPSGDLSVEALIGSMDVTDQTAAWFPELHRFLSPARSHTGKRQILLTEAFPDRVLPSSRLAVILTPEITEQEDTSLAPTSRVALLNELMFYSLDLQDAALAQRHLDFLLQTVQQTPVYRLRLGRNRSGLPALLREVLLTEGQPSSPVSVSLAR